MLGRVFGKKAGATAQKFNGHPDFLKTVCAAEALIAAADGEIEDSEIKATVKAVKANKALSDGFDQSTIEASINKMLDRRAATRRLARRWQKLRSSNEGPRSWVLRPRELPKRTISRTFPIPIFNKADGQTGYALGPEFFTVPEVAVCHFVVSVSPATALWLFLNRHDRGW